MSDASAPLAAGAALAQVGDVEGLARWLRASGEESAACAAAGWVGAVAAGLDQAFVEQLADPPSAFVALDSYLSGPLAAVHGRAGAVAVAKLAAQSRWLGRQAATRADLLEPLLATTEALAMRRSREELLATLRAAVAGVPDPLAAIRRLRLAELTRAFYREAYGLGSVMETTGEVSALAEACLEVVLELTLAAVPASERPMSRAGEPIPFCVIGLGKLGGQELNFGSDVDIVYVYGTDDGAVAADGGSWSVHQAFARIARAVTQAVDQATSDGRIWRVDLRLRPEGARGPLVHSARALEGWYEAWGRTFERAVWLKARPVAGAVGLGEAVLERLEPFVFRRHLDFGALEELRDMKDRIDRHARTVGARRVRLGTLAARVNVPAGWPDGAEDLLGWDTKTGTGGVREVEFSVQALQLVYGGRMPELRCTSTLPALERLLVAGLLPSNDVDALASAYSFFRLVEHRIQMEGDRHTHAIPQKVDAFCVLAARLGQPAAAFAETLLHHQRRVSAIFSRLFADGPREAGPPISPEVQALLDLNELDDADAAQQALFAAAGFDRPRQSIGQLMVLHTKPYTPFSPSADGALRRMGGRFLAEVCGSADPDVALVHLTTFLLRVGHRRAFYDVLANANMALSVLVTLFGSSRYFSELFVRRPELFDVLLGTPDYGARWDRARLSNDLDRDLALVDPGDAEGRLHAMRTFKHRHELRVALGDLAGELEIEDVGEQLTAMADVLIDHVHAEAWAEMVARHGELPEIDGRPPEFAILGLGKLGGGELLYGSDLDLVFIYEGQGWTGGPKPTSAADFYARLARRMINFLTTALSTGRLYDVDTRLRPNGGQGALVVSWDAFEAYQRDKAVLAEQQALLRGRVVWGGPVLTGRIAELRRQHCFRPRSEADRAGIVRAVLRLRAQIEAKERPRPGEIDIKFSAGGLLDAEFGVQMVQLACGADEPSLASPSTLAALHALAQLDVVPRAEVEQMWDTYAFLRRVENRLRIVRGVGASAVPVADADEMDRLARRAGYRGARPGAELGRDLQAAMAVGRSTLHTWAARLDGRL